MSQTGSGIDGKFFRSALGSFATGVTIVTTHDSEGGDVGLTANSFNSVSLDPPMVLWSLAKTSGSMPAFIANDHFAVHVLAADQQPLSDQFARRSTNKFAGLEMERGVGNVPLLDGCSARFQCRTAFRYEGGDHVIFVGEVQAFDHFDQPPLVFHGGKYAKMMPRAAADANSGEEVESSFRKDFLGYLLGLASIQLHNPVKTCCAQRGISEPVYYVLTLLMARPDLCAGQVNDLLALTGEGLTPALAQQLVDSGWVEPGDGSREARLKLTARGRQLAIEIFAVAKAAEETATRLLDFEELTLLKQLLKQVIRGTLATATESASSPQ